MSVAGILDAMRADRPLAERVVWACLENHANGHRFWSISIRDIAKELHIRPGTVVDAVKALIADGIVRAVKRVRTVTTYFMLRTYGPETPCDAERNQPKEPVTVADTEPAVACDADRHVVNPPSKYNPPDSDSASPDACVSEPVLELVCDRNVPPVATLGTDQDPDFAAFWALYPKKDAKGRARKAWRQALKRASAADIIAGLRRYGFSDRPRFIPLPATWLNDERWLTQSEPDEFDAVLAVFGLAPKGSDYDFDGPVIDQSGQLART